MVMLLFLTGPFWLLMLAIESRLLDAGIINTKDLWPVIGNETGTISDYLLNVWHWDGVILLLFLAIVPNMIFGTWLVRRAR